MTAKTPRYDATREMISLGHQFLLLKGGRVPDENPERLPGGHPEETAPGGDAELIITVRSGDTAAYGTLYERHVAAARNLARQLVHEPAEVDDVVAETFTRVLDAISRGGGPTEAFRPYLLTAVRRVAYDRLGAQRTQIPTDEAQLPDPGVPFIDPAVVSLERSLIVRAFMTLPERWSAVLWHTEVEQARPAEVAPLLGLTPGGVAALSYRAREGLRQAYLQQHLSGVARQECRPVAGRLGGYVRDALSRRETRMVENHLKDCGDCQTAYAELADVNVSLRGMVAPIFLGAAAAGYLTGLSGGAGAGAAGAAAPALAGSAGGSRAVRAVRWLRHGPRQQRTAVGAGAALIAVALAALAAILVSSTAPLRGKHPAGAASAPLANVPSAGPARTPGHRGAGGSKPGATSPAPAPSPASPSPTGPAPLPSAPRPSVSPSPVRSPRPGVSVPPSARLAVRVGVTGRLRLLQMAVVMVDVTDVGNGPTGALTAHITVPQGTLSPGTLSAAMAPAGGLPGTSGPRSAELADAAFPADDLLGWSCFPDAGGLTCMHGPIAAGGAATAPVSMFVIGSAACGAPVQVTVTSGAVSASGQSAATVQCRDILERGGFGFGRGGFGFGRGGFGAAGGGW